jgi:hypothetical protein
MTLHVLSSAVVPSPVTDFMTAKLVRFLADRISMVGCFILSEQYTSIVISSTNITSSLSLHLVQTLLILLYGHLVYLTPSLYNMNRCANISFGWTETHAPVVLPSQFKHPLNKFPLICLAIYSFTAGIFACPTTQPSVLHEAMLLVCKLDRFCFL